MEISIKFTNGRTSKYENLAKLLETLVLDGCDIVRRNPDPDVNHDSRDYLVQAFDLVSREIVTVGEFFIPPFYGENSDD